MAFPNKIIHNPGTGQQIRFIQTSRDTTGQLLEMESTFRANSVEPIAHYHPNQFEDFTVWAGELTVAIAGQTKTLRQGDTLHVPANTVHSMWNASDAETIVNWQVKPALNTEYFFETTFGLANDGKVGTNNRPLLLQTALLVRYFSDVFLLAKPPKLLQKLIFGILSPIAYLAGYRATYKKYLD